MLPSQRDLFDIPDDVSYLNCAYMSPQLRSVRAAGERAIAAKSRPWEISPADFFADSETARALFAELIGGDADGVAIIPSVSYGIAVAAANLPLAPGQNVVVLEEQFPSNVYPWLERASDCGAAVVTVPRPADHDWAAAIDDCMDGNTAIVAVPNCHWTDGSLVDLVRVGARARELGAALVVDATQSLGAYPFDVARVRPDFLVTAAYKWLLGPYSLGFLYADRERRAGRPLEHNWITRAGSEHFGGLVQYTSDFQPGARRYDMGERSNFALLPMALAALRQILDWKVEAVAAAIGELTGRIETGAAALGIAAMPANRRAPHLVGLRLGGDAPDELATQLAARQVFVSVRGDRLRVAPHVYNTAADVDRFIAALRELTGR